MNWQEKIVINNDILCGKPVIKGTRISVEFIMELLANDWSENDIISNYPGLTKDDIKACLAYATESLKSEKVYLLKT
jgi:uncharacterized protein (DUF433 family)